MIGVSRFLPATLSTDRSPAAGVTAGGCNDTAASSTIDVGDRRLRHWRKRHGRWSLRHMAFSPAGSGRQRFATTTMVAAFALLSVVVMATCATSLIGGIGWASKTLLALGSEMSKTVDGMRSWLVGEVSMLAARLCDELMRCRLDLAITQLRLLDDESVLLKPSAWSNRCQPMLTSRNSSRSGNVQFSHFAE